jgi:sulfur transfer protein SufE
MATPEGVTDREERVPELCRKIRVRQYFEIMIVAEHLTPARTTGMSI